MILKVSLAWRDERLIFHNLLPASNTSEEHENVLDLDAVNYLWHPKLHFPRALFEDNLRIQKKERVEIYARLNPETTGEPTNVNSYEGKTSMRPNCDRIQI